MSSVRTVLLFGLTALALLGLTANPARAQWWPQGVYDQNTDEARLIQQVQSDTDPDHRRQAARRLGKVGTDAAVNALATAAAYDPDRDTRIAAGDAIAKIRRRTTAVMPAAATPIQPDRMTRLIQSWYVRYLHRHVSPAAIAPHLEAIRTGTSPETVLASILSSDEYYQLNGSYPAAWIAALYRDVLGRAPRPDELRVWLQNLRQQGGARPQIAVQFLHDSRTELANRPPTR